MLKTRVATALVLAPLILWAVGFWSTPYLAVLFAGIVVLGGWEWSRLVGLDRSRPLQGLYLLSLALLTAGGWWYLQADLPLLPVFAVSGLWWLIALFWLSRYGGGGSMQPSPLIGAVAGYVVLLPVWLGLVVLHREAGYYWILLVLILVWGADVGAYFTGRAVGRRKLAPRVSPGKTWEGVVGGLVVAVAAALALHLLMPDRSLPWDVLLAVGVPTVLVSVVGDLFESMLKRQRGMKDSSQLLPGHGGVLDRVDSLTAATPIFVLGLLCWQLTL